MDGYCLTYMNNMFMIKIVKNGQNDNVIVLLFN